MSRSCISRTVAAMNSACSRKQLTIRRGAAAHHARTRSRASPVELSRFVFLWIHACINAANARFAAALRIRIIQRPTMSCIDGFQLDRFVPGVQYDVSPLFAAYMVTEGWAEPVEPIELDPATPPDLQLYRGDLNGLPPNLEREFDPPYYQGVSTVAPDRRRRSRRPNRVDAIGWKAISLSVGADHAMSPPSSRENRRKMPDRRRLRVGGRRSTDRRPNV